jgi:hypothetical protein
LHNLTNTPMKTSPKCSKSNGNSVRVCLGTHDAKTMRGDYCGHAFLKLGFAGSTTTACGAIAGTVAL